MEPINRLEPINRRDFLRLRTVARRRVAELSCERLYMRQFDARLTARRPDVDFPCGDPSAGEPPAVFDERTPRQLFDLLERDLEDVDVLRVVDARWLAGDDLRCEFESLLASFRSRGGRVEFHQTAGPPSD
jgi:hypothetical protein